MAKFEYIKTAETDCRTQDYFALDLHIRHRIHPNAEWHNTLTTNLWFRFQFGARVPGNMTGIMQPSEPTNCLTVHVWCKTEYETSKTMPQYLHEITVRGQPNQMWIATNQIIIKGTGRNNTVWLACFWSPTFLDYPSPRTPNHCSPGHFKAFALSTKIPVTSAQANHLGRSLTLVQPE